MQFGNEAYSRKFGTTFAYPAYAEIRKFYEANEAEGNKLADEYIKSAARQVEPPREQVVMSIRLHLAIVELMRAEKANAITFGCIGAPISGDLPAYPCISFSLLNDVGLYGCCEGDVECAITNILVTGFSGKPGFVTDPIFDTSHSEVIHAHCSAPTAMEGVGQRSFPYSIRSYPSSGETRAAALQVHFGGSGPVTVAKFSGPQNLLVSTGEVLGNVDIDRGCRSKLRTRVKDVHKLLDNWAMATTAADQRPPALLSTLPYATQEQLHRVAFYGDHVEMLKRIGRLTGFRVIRED
jgi:L-fucose isomerase-like protein